MAGSKGDVELVIRAKNEASKNLDAVNKSLKALADQQTLAGNSAGNAQGKFAQLGQQLNQLRTNAANLKSLSSVASVLDAATGALGRLRAGAADAGTSLEALQRRQAKLATDSAAAASASKSTADAVKQQDTAYKAAQKSVRDLATESGKLATAEKNAEAGLVRVAGTITTLNAKLTESAAKQQAAAAAASGSEGVTKRQAAALDAANAALARRQAALDAAVAKEAALRASLDSTRTAIAANKTAQDTANAALAAQAKVLADARTANAAAAASVAAIGAAQRSVGADIAAANKAFQTSVAALQAAEAEYVKLKAVADAARAAVGANAPALDQSGAAAGRAAVQVAILAARFAALNGAGGARTGALGIDPAAIRAADGTVRELGVTIRLAGNEATKASVTVDQLKAAVTGLGQAKNQLTGLTDTMTKQQAAVAGAEAAWRDARAEQLRLAAAMKATASPSAELAAGLGRAQAAAKLAWQEFRAQRTAADDMTSSLQRAGVGSGTFASAQAALAQRIAALNAQIASGNSSLAALPGVLARAGNAAGSAEPQVSKLRIAMNGLLGAVNGLASKTNPLGGLTSSITGAVGAAVGLYGIKDQLDKILQAGLALDGNKQRFASAFGSVEAGAKELEYAREVALNLKLPINDLARGYSRLALAAKGTALEGDSARKIFEAFAQSSRVNQTSTADLEGVFTALTQIMSKGKVQAEELRQQLGDRLPGALQLMAEGLGITVKELDAMMKKGELTSNTLLNMAQAVSTRVAPVLVQALTSPAARIADFNNRVTMLRENIAGSGFLDAYASGLEKIGKALSTPEAIQGAKDLGQALADMVTWLAQAPEHFDAIINSIKALGIAWVALQITSLVTGVISFAGAIGTAAIAMGLLDAAMIPVLAGLAVLAAAVATVAGAFFAWKLAEWAYENFPAFAEGCQQIKLAAMDAWDGIITAWDIAAATLKGSFKRVLALIKDQWYGTLNDILNFSPTLSAKFGLGDFAEQIGKQAADAAKEQKDAYSNLEAEIEGIKKKGLERQQQNAKDTEDAIFAYHKKRVGDQLTLDGPLNQPNTLAFPGATAAQSGVQFPGFKPQEDAPLTGTAPVTGVAPYVKDTSTEEAKAAARAAKARVQLEKQVANEMYSIRAKLEGKSADDLQEKIDAVPAKYAALYAKLDALGKGQADQDRKDLDALVLREQQIVREKAKVKELADAKKAAHDAEMAQRAEEKQVMTDVQTALEQRKTLQEQLGRAYEEGDDEAIPILREGLQGATEDYRVALESALGFWAVSDSGQAEKQIAQLTRMRDSLTKVKDTAVLTGNTIGKAFGSNLLGGVNTFVDTLASTGNVFQSLKAGFLDFASSFLIQIAKMILQALLLRALGGVFGTAAGTIGGAIQTGAGGVATPAKHGGGVVGSRGGMTKMVNPAVFQNAAVMHGGGQAGKTGLKANEVQTVLEKGETVRTEAQEAALARNQASGGPGEAPRVDLKIVNAIDSTSVLEQGLSTVPGQQIFMNFLRANRGKIQGILN